MNVCLQVDEQKLSRELDKIRLMYKLRESLNTKFPVSSYCGLILTVWNVLFVVLMLTSLCLFLCLCVCVL